jgi:hypothetical protein
MIEVIAGVAIVLFWFSPAFRAWAEETDGD